MKKNEIAYEKIKRMIFAGELSNDQGISEKQLADLTNMSRTPIRAALQKLEMEGHLKTLPNKGIILSEMSITEAKASYDLRIAVELYVLRKVITMLSDSDYMALQAIIEKQKDAAKDQDYTKFLELDKEFHQYFLYIYRNDNIKRISTNFRERFYPFALKGVKKEGRMQHTIEEHQNILNKLKEKDLNQALAVLEEHIEKGIWYTIQAI